MNLTSPASPQEGELMVEIGNLSVRKGKTTICSVPSMSIADGERLAVIGANGSGKTTLLRVLGNIESNYSGTCRVNVPPLQRVYVHQNPILFRGTVLRNTMYGLRARGINRLAGEHQALSWLKRMGVEQLASRRVEKLSGGERRRVALARAMAVAPRLLLLDEPLAEMDEKGQDAVIAAIDELTNTTVIIASPTDITDTLATRVCRFA